MVGIGLSQHINDGALSRLIDFGDEIVVIFGGDAQLLYLERGASDDRSGTTRGFHRDIDHGVHGGSVKIGLLTEISDSPHSENERCGMNTANCRYFK